MASQIENKAVIHCKYDEMIAVDKLARHPKQANKHPEEQIQRLAEILKYQGWRSPICVSTSSGYITRGHGRLDAAKLNGWDSVPVIFQDYTDEDQEVADLHADNGIGQWSELDLSLINLQIPDFDPEFNVDLLGLKDFVIEPADKISDGEKSNPKLADRFLVPPFSILDSRQGYWQDRKRQWLALGIKSEIGRGGSVAHQSQDKLWALSRQTK